MTPKRVSISQVAEAAGVSSMTVSRVLRGLPPVKPETRARVVDVMIRLGYVPSAAAQALRSSERSRPAKAALFALIFGSGTECSVTFFHDVARGVEKAASELGLCPISISMYENPRELWIRLQNVFATHSLSGALLVGKFEPDMIGFIRENVGPIVMIDGPAQSGQGIGSVESGNLEGSLLALDYLVAAGCRRIRIITVEEAHYFAKAMTIAAGIRRSADVEIVLWYDCDSCERAESLVEERWLGGERFDAIFTTDDFAIGAMKAMRTLGVGIPSQVRVVGFDDIPYASFCVPPLTSVRIDKSLLGGEAVRTLVALERNPGRVEDIKKVIKPSLVVRESA